MYAARNVESLFARSSQSDAIAALVSILISVVVDLLVVTVIPASVASEVGRLYGQKTLVFSFYLIINVTKGESSNNNDHCP